MQSGLAEAWLQVAQHRIRLMRSGIIPIDFEQVNVVQAQLFVAGREAKAKGDDALAKKISDFRRDFDEAALDMVATEIRTEAYGPLLGVSTATARHMAENMDPFDVLERVLGRG